jgi:hypothetical protein
MEQAPDYFFRRTCRRMARHIGGGGNVDIGAQTIPGYGGRNIARRHQRGPNFIVNVSTFSFSESSGIFS